MQLISLEQYKRFQFQNKSYFIYPQWFELIEKEGFSPHLMEHNGTVLPLCLIKSKVFFKHLYLSSYGLYGDFAGAEDEANIAYIIKKLKKDPFIRQLTYAVDPTKQNGFLEKTLSTQLKAKQVSAHILELDGTYEEILKTKINPTRRNEINRTKKNPAVNIIDMDIKEASNWDKYYDIYLSSLLRWNQPQGYSKQFFYNMRQLDPAHVKLFGVAIGEQLVAGGVFFIYDDRFMYWHGATLMDDGIAKQYPTSAMFDYIIRWTLEKRLKYFNFGSSDGLEGVAKFKESWGAQRVLYNIYSLR